MRRRLLISILGVVLLTSLVLGVPLMYTAWLWVEDLTRHDLQVRLNRIGDEIVAQEGDDGLVDGPLDVSAIKLVVPDGGQLVIIYPAPDDGAVRVDLGPERVPGAIAESLSLGTRGSLRLAVPRDELRARQWQAIGVVGFVVLASIGAGTTVATRTARRFADPMRDVAARAARLAEGDFRPDARRHRIPELDRVSDVLDAATVEIASRLQREHALVADVSHQLRSRLTAVRLRLDELSTYPDAAVVDEAEAAMAQVDRLTTAIDDLVRASRVEGSGTAVPILVLDELDGLVSEWQAQFADAGRSLTVLGDRALRAPVTGSRLREAVSVLIDNALMHGAGTCRITVRMARPVENREPSVCVEVADEGPGVSDRLAPHIFDRGFSGAGSTGVGLALARALVEADGGRLELQRRRPAIFAIFLASATPHVHPRPGDPR